MKSTMLIGLIALSAGCATLGTRPSGETAAATQWQGHLLRNGLRSPITVELSRAGDDWGGRLSAGENAVPLQNVQVTGTRVHFELPGEGAFDGAVAGDEIAGSGPADASFALRRETGTANVNPESLLYGP